MGNRKHFAALAFCLVALWACRFVPHDCKMSPGAAADGGASWLGLVASGALLSAFLYVPVYDLIALLTHWLGLEDDFDPIQIYSEDHNPGDRPLSQGTKNIVYLVALAVAGFFLLPLWIRLAYCH